MSKILLRQQLDRTHEAHARRQSSGLASSIRDLEEWQKQRLLSTYADISADSSHRAATQFFIDELYAPDDVPGRDADLERMYPSMVRLLPDSVLGTVAAALELQALTLQLDLETARWLHQQHVRIHEMTVADYSRAYRALDQRPVRSQQIDLIVKVGTELDHYVRNPVIYATLKMTRVPARLAGLAHIQQFLENGFTAFRAIGGAREFVATVERRERRILDQLMAGDVVAVAQAFGQPAGS